MAPDTQEAFNKYLLTHLDKWFMEPRWDFKANKWEDQYTVHSLHGI